MAKGVTYSFIEHQLDDSIQLRKSFNFVNNYKLFSDMYRGNFSAEVEYVYNLYYSIFTSIIANTYRKNPKVFVKSDNPNDFFMAAAIQKITNDWISPEDQNMKSLYRRTILDTLLGGFGVILVGSGGIFGRSKETVLNQFTREFPELFEGVSSPDEFHDENDEFVWARRIPPYDVLFPYESSLDVVNMRFVAIRYYRKEEHIKRDKRYRGVSRGGFTLYDDKDDKEERAKSLGNTTSKTKWGMLWDYYDNESGKIYTVIEGQEKIIKIEEMITDRLPISVLKWTEDSEYAYPPSEASVLFDKQFDLITADAQERELRNTFKLMLFLNQNKINKTEIDETQDSTHTRGYVLIDGKPSENVMFGKYDVPNDIFKGKNQIEGNARVEIGHGRNQSGGESATRVTAAEARIIQAGGMVRVNERVDAVLESMEEVCLLAHKFRLEFWNTSRSIYIPRMGQTNFTKDDLYPEGKMNFEAIVYDAAPEHFETQRLYILQALDRIGNMGIPISAQLRILREAYPEVTAIAEIADMIEQQEQQQQLQQQQQAVP